MRIQELANLNRSNIFPQEQRIKVRQGKKGNEDYIPVVSDATWQALKRYEKIRETIPGTGEAYFVGWNGQRIVPRQVNRHLKDYASRAKISKNVHAHILRHSFGTLFYKATQDLVKTQLALRYKDISSTMIYVHIEKEAVIEGLRLANLLRGGEKIMEEETTQLWIKQREEELKLLEKEMEGWGAVIKKQRVDIANYKEEIEFIKELQNKETRQYEPKIGEKQLVKMKKELEKKKNSLEKIVKEWEGKITKIKNLRTYVNLAHREKW